ncbi:unnamed protein product [Rotaria sordida]|uniref:Protein SDA1 n=1 Tax=Rotaria sordida TaxID=392033 RepID=A0A815RLG3_9BILA|nr:unnamed protein product [Rotaria sordida]
MPGNDRLTRSLPHLQNLIKRDPDAYREDFKLQYLHFESQFMELTAKPDIWNKSLAENISFVSQVAHCYPEESKGLSQMFMDVLRLYSTVLNNDIRLTLQNLMCTIIKESNAIAVKMALVQVAALNFFLCNNQNKDKEKDSDSDDDEKLTKKEILLGHRVGKKFAKRKKKAERALRTLEKQKKKKKVEIFDYSALHLLYDPQDFAERLFRQLETSDERFEVKLLHQDLLSRLIGLHQLLLLNFYPYLQRYIQPHQRQVTKILLFVAQASHELVPPDILQSICKTIANHFITERNSGEVMAVGLNTIREICSRCYLAMDEDLLHDLAKYKSYRDKSVSASARSLIQLFREKNPQLLERKDRGKPTEFQRDLVPLDYGQSNPKSYLEGAEILQQHIDDQDQQSDNEQQDQLSEQDWIDVSHSDDDDDDHDDDDDNEEEDDDNNEENDNQQQDHKQENIDKMEKEMTEEERRERAISISTQRILTQHDFEQLKMIEMKKRIQDRRKNRLEQSISNTGKRKTISIDTDSDSDNENNKNSQENEQDWIDVSHSDNDDDDVDDNEEEDDDNNEENNNQQQDHKQENIDKMEKEMTEEERRERAISISTQRILTQHDFEQLKIIEMKKRIQDRRKNRLEQSISNTGKRKTISIDTDSDSDNENNKNSQENLGLISLKDIERVHKKRAHDKESRLETVIAGREGRPKFGKWKKEKGQAGTTNKEKLKTKNFQMLKPKLRKKQKRSFRDKQIALRDALLKDKRLR